MTGWEARIRRGAFRSAPKATKPSAEETRVVAAAQKRGRGVRRIEPAARALWARATGVSWRRRESNPRPPDSASDSGAGADSSDSEESDNAPGECDEEPPLDDDPRSQ